MAYATLDQLKAYLYAGNAVKPVSDDGLLSSLLDRATAIVEQYTGRVWQASGSTVKTFEADSYNGGTDLLLTDTQALTVTLVQEDGVTVDVEDYYLLPRNGSVYDAIRKKAGTWTGTVTVTGTWGAATVPPADIVHVCIRLAAWLYKQKDTAADIDQPFVGADGQLIVPGGLPRDIMEIMSRRQRLAFSAGY